MSHFSCLMDCSLSPNEQRIAFHRTNVATTGELAHLNTQRALVVTLISKTESATQSQGTRVASVAREKRKVFGAQLKYWGPTEGQG